MDHLIWPGLAKGIMAEILLLNDRQVVEDGTGLFSREIRAFPLLLLSW